MLWIRKKYLKNFYFYFCFGYLVYINYYLSINIYIFKYFFLLCLLNCYIIRVDSILYNIGENNLLVLVFVNIFFLCWIKIIFMVGVFVEVEFVNIFYDLEKYKYFKIL